MQLIPKIMKTVPEPEPEPRFRLRLRFWKKLGTETAVPVPVPTPESELESTNTLYNIQNQTFSIFSLVFMFLGLAQTSTPKTCGRFP